MNPESDHQFWLTLLRTGNESQRMAAVRFLQDRQKQEDQETLLETLDSDPDGQVRLFALRALIRNAEPDLLPIVRKAFYNSEPNIRGEAALYLLEQRQEADLHLVCDRFEQIPPHAWQQFYLLLAESEDPYVLPVLCDALHSDDHDLRSISDAIDRLARSGDVTHLRRARETLQRLLLEGAKPIAEITRALRTLDAALGKDLPIAARTEVTPDPRLPYPASALSVSRPLETKRPQQELTVIPSPHPSEAVLLATILLICVLIALLLTCPLLPVLFPWLKFPFYSSFLGFFWSLCLKPLFSTIKRMSPRVTRQRLELRDRTLAVTSQWGALPFLFRVRRYQLTPEARLQAIPAKGRNNASRAPHLALLAAGNRIIRFAYSCREEERERIAVQLNAYLEALEPDLAAETHPLPVSENAPALTLHGTHEL